jgi:hypothetical protein
LTDPCRFTLDEINGYEPLKESEGELVLFSIGNEYMEHEKNVPRRIPRLKPQLPLAARTAVKHRHLSRKKKSRNKPNTKTVR